MLQEGVHTAAVCCESIRAAPAFSTHSRLHCATSSEPKVAVVVPSGQAEHVRVVPAVNEALL